MKYKESSKYIASLNVNGLQGRVLRLPVSNSKRREILFVYDRHASLEKWWPLLKQLGQFGAVTAPDLPGFGGMDSLYSIGQKADLNTLADYLASFVKLRYSRRRLSIVGVGYGFVVVTRMLQRYPDLAKKVDVTISIGGFVHQDDLRITRRRKWYYLLTTQLLSYALPAMLFRNIALHPLAVRFWYTHKLRTMPATTIAEQKRKAYLTKQETILWHVSDVRTAMQSLRNGLRLDNCTAQIGLPVWHIQSPHDRLYDAHKIEQHLNIAYQSATLIYTNQSAATLEMRDIPDSMSILLPKQARKLLKTR